MEQNIRVIEMWQMSMGHKTWTSERRAIDNKSKMNTRYTSAYGPTAVEYAPPMTVVQAEELAAPEKYKWVSAL